jgi:hypothetical protein
MRKAFYISDEMHKDLSYGDILLLCGKGLWSALAILSLFRFILNRNGLRAEGGMTL